MGEVNIPPPSLEWGFARPHRNRVNWPNFILWSLLLYEVLGNMCIVILCEPGCNVINFEINIFPIKQCYQGDQKVKTNIQISWDRKALLSSFKYILWILWDLVSLKQILKDKHRRVYWLKLFKEVGLSI